jgi:hypothetical protein
VKIQTQGVSIKQRDGQQMWWRQSHSTWLIFKTGVIIELLNKCPTYYSVLVQPKTCVRCKDGGQTLWKYHLETCLNVRVWRGKGFYQESMEEEQAWGGESEAGVKKM